jgi:lipopolysaccharide transport system ATP-binding protein
MPNSIIEVNGISERYRLGQIGVASFRDEVQRWWEGIRSVKRAGGGLFGEEVPATRTESSTVDFWSLRGVSFNVEIGEVAGIVGKNGAGKSTLLKFISRITEPTKGKLAGGESLRVCWRSVLAFIRN